MIGWLKCARGEHRWWPDSAAREFLPQVNICLRAWCREEQIVLPWGECLGGHPLRDHYPQDATPRPVPGCAGPR